ncbi:exodeoxyribonuclease VII small subunit [Candidatus Saccharibacteria bacterium]|jgi:exodeoxyribonuclease VII small subunit|nr:exodeoxyribonuclease VII small subunit [Candidatus Saccharibacteria bacterium]MBP9552123.1 exodeoxyribonuclease VII small subunit [Candidatus Saccharibacteria bacterium]
MLEKNEVNNKFDEINSILSKFENSEISLRDAAEQYEKAIESAKELQSYFNDLKNEIIVLNEDFTKEINEKDS